MKEPTPEQLEAISRLVATGNPHFEEVAGWFREALAEADKRNRVLYGEAGERIRGEAKTLEVIVARIDGALGGDSAIKIPIHHASIV